MQEITNGVYYLDRHAWGADTSLPRLGGPEHPGVNYRLINRQERTRLIIHHTVGIDPDETPNVIELLSEAIYRMRRLQIVRSDDLGADVPYNFVGFPAELNLIGYPEYVLIVCEGRGYDRSGAHTGGQWVDGTWHNVAGIALALAGDFENYRIDLSPWLPLISRFAQHLRHEAGMVNLGVVRPSDSCEAFAHKHFANTSCPGWRVFHELGRIKFIQEEGTMLRGDFERFKRDFRAYQDFMAGLLHEFYDADKGLQGLVREALPELKAGIDVLETRVTGLDEDVAGLRDELAGIL